MELYMLTEQKYLMAKQVPSEARAQGYKWSQLLHNHYLHNMEPGARGCGVREPEHTILANLLSPFP